MSRLVIDFAPDNDTSWAQLVLKQEGMRPFVLPLTWLPEFLHALENTHDFAEFYFWKNFSVRHTRTSCKLSVSTNEKPLLQLDTGQTSKLIAHLKEQYASYL